MITDKHKAMYETMIIRTLFKERSVKSQRILIEKIMDMAIKEKVTISESTIKNIIEGMSKENKIDFTQEKGWKIKI